MRLFFVLSFFTLFSCGKVTPDVAVNNPGAAPDPNSTEYLEAGAADILNDACIALGLREKKFLKATVGQYKYNFQPYKKSCEQGREQKLSAVSATLVNPDKGVPYFSGGDNIFTDYISVMEEPMEFPCSGDYKGEKSFYGATRRTRFFLEAGRYGRDALIIITEFEFNPISDKYERIKKIDLLVEMSGFSNNYGMVKSRVEHNFTCSTKNISNYLKVDLL